MKLESYTRTLHEIEINLLKRKLDKTENLINKKIVYKKYILSLIVFIIFLFLITTYKTISVPKFLNSR